MHDPARPRRGALPRHLLRRREARGPRHQVSGGIRHAPGGRQLPARARVRLHRGTVGRLPLQLRRLAEEGDRERPHPRTAALRERPRDLQRRRTHGLESGLPPHRHGGPGLLHQRRRGGAEGRPVAREGRGRVGEDLPHRRCRLARRQRPPHALHDVRGDARGGRHRPQPQAQGHGPLPRDRRHQERAQGGLRLHRARDLHGRRMPRPPARAERARRAGTAVRTGQRAPWARVRPVAARDRRPPGDARRRRGELPADPRRRWPTRHGGRLRLRVEPARRLREGADVFRPRGRHRSARGAHLRDPHRRRDHGTWGRPRHPGGGQARRPARRGR